MALPLPSRSMPGGSLLSGAILGRGVFFFMPRQRAERRAVQGQFPKPRIPAQNKFTAYPARTMPERDRFADAEPNPLR
jgi:hypothetical protein